MSEHIVAIFTTDVLADAAARDLETAGIPSSAIRRYRPHAEGTAPGTSSSSETLSTGGGFWAWLLGEESNTETSSSYYPRDEEQYLQGARAGNAVVSVMLEDASRIDHVVKILEAHHPLEMQEETDNSGVDISAAELSSMSAQLSSGSSAAPPASTPTPTQQGVRVGEEEVIPLAAEQIEVGKRSVDRGVTRVRRYVVERPVEQDITLRGQRVTIERRRPIQTTGVSGEAFQERVVEVHETEEVPVVAKTAHVAEEVTIRKEETERTETVRETVRLEEVEVTDEHGRPVSRPSST